MDDHIAGLEPHLVRKWWATKDPALEQQLAEGFWDRQILRKWEAVLGVRLIDTIPIREPEPDPPVPPGPLPYDQFQFIVSVVLENVLAAVAGDPNPVPNLVDVLSDRDIRIASLERAVARAQQAVEDLENELTHVRQGG